jgi:hypothetical protein
MVVAGKNPKITLRNIDWNLRKEPRFIAPPSPSDEVD